MALTPPDAPAEASNVAEPPADNASGRTDNVLTAGSGFDSQRALRELFTSVSNRDALGQINDILKMRSAPSAVMGAFPPAGDLLADLGSNIQLAHGPGETRHDGPPDIRLAQTGERRRTGDRNLNGGLTPDFVKEIKNTYGVDLSIRDGKYNLSFRADGIKHSIPLELPLSSDSLPKIKENLDQITQKRIKDIEAKFGITIKSPDQFAGNQDDLCRADKGKRPLENPNDPNAIRSRQPSLPELYALENALAASAPSQRTANGIPLEVTFADRAPLKDQKGESQNHLASYLPPDGPNDKAKLFIYPAAAKSPPTDRDTRRPGESLASTIRHEIGHNQQFNAFPDGKLPESVLNQLGFIQFANPKFPDRGESPYNYAIQTRDGRFFARSEPDCKSAAGGWYQVDREGNPLGPNGEKVSDPTKAVKMKDETMDRMSLRKYPTGYYDSPLEVLSEGFAAFTGSAQSRESLRIRFRHVYDALQTVEQEQQRAFDRKK
ncbi:MAG: hypothetical protein KIT34_10295 [Cyanobacteria bacterium TGS_CYA1]|nr:hypothetical protein [Cyanobacteria bacterium TGS_CYA1]